MRMVNYANGSLLMIGMYIAFWLSKLLGIDPILSIPICAASLFLVGVLIEKGIIDPILDAPTTAQTTVTFGLMLLLNNLALAAFKADVRIAEIPWGYGDWTIEISFIRFSFTRILSFMIAFAITVIFFLFLKYTDFGLAMRATQQDRVMASLVGVDVRKTYSLAFGLGAACLGAAGALLTTMYFIYPEVGGWFLILANTVCVLGGVGNYLGAFLGGIVIGLIEGLFGFYVHTGIKQVSYLVVFITILLVRPQGFFGRTARR
jgi:branched-chain amino acid transport system permease protein